MSLPLKRRLREWRERLDRFDWVSGNLVTAVALLLTCFAFIFRRFGWAGTEKFSNLIEQLPLLTKVVLVSLTIGSFVSLWLLSHNPAESLLGVLQHRRWRSRLLIRVAGLSSTAVAKVLQVVSTPATSYEDMVLASQINADAFSDSATYSGTLPRKLERNAAIVRRCPEALRLVKSGARVIGISYLIPLTPDFCDEYRAGRVSDLYIRAAMVPPRGEPVGCVLLFAIALLPIYESRRGRERRHSLIKRLILVHMLHVRYLLDAYDAPDAPLLVQVEKRSIAVMLRLLGFRRLKKAGADGDPLFEATFKEVVTASGAGRL